MLNVNLTTLYDWAAAGVEKGAQPGRSARGRYQPLISQTKTKYLAPHFFVHIVNV